MDGGVFMKRGITERTNRLGGGAGLGTDLHLLSVWLLGELLRLPWPGLDMWVFGLQQNPRLAKGLAKGPWR